MAEFRDMVLAWCILLPILAGLYVWVVTYTVFSSPPKTSNDLAPSPSALTFCSPEILRDSMSTSLRWMTLLYCFAGLLTYFTRKVVDTIATVEAKGDVMEEEMYKYAQELLKEAVKDMEKALTNVRSNWNSAAQDDYVKAVGRRNLALAKVERASPKEGLARVARRKRTWVKVVFIANVVASLGAGVAAACAYYYSLELQYGCTYGAETIVPFSVLGFTFLTVHYQSCLVAATKD